MRPMTPCRTLVTRRQALVAGAGALGALAARPAAAAHMVRPWPSARPVPELDLPDIDGRRWTLASHLGSVVVLNFWATWCEPCRLEMPSLEAMGTRLRPQGLVVCAVNYKEPAALIRQFLERMPFKATILLDTDGDAASEWTPRAFPSSVLIGRDGRPVTTVIGELDWVGSVARELIDPLIAAPRKT